VLGPVRRPHSSPAPCNGVIARRVALAVADVLERSNQAAREGSYHHLHKEKSDHIVSQRER